MNILCLSDLHLDENERTTGQRLIPDLILFIQKKKADMVVISGDIAGTSMKTIEYIEQLKEFLDIPIYFIPGNHDIWSHTNSWEEYEKLLNHPSCIENKIIHLTKQYVLIGWMGWYDYSFKPDYLFYDQIISSKKKHWKDYKYALWGKSDPDLYHDFFLHLKELLEKVKNKKVILSTHFVPYQSFISYRKYNKEWNSCNAFIGSKTTGDLIDNYKNIEYVLFGHTHSTNIKKKNLTTLVCTPLGYQHEWSDNPFFPLSFKEALEKRHYLITI